jgi:hypothetical protein
MSEGGSIARWLNLSHASMRHRPLARALKLGLSAADTAGAKAAATARAVP